MEKEFQLGGGNWWDNNSSISTNRFDSGTSSTTPTTSTSATIITPTTTVSNSSSSNWPTETDHVNIKPRNTFLNSVSVSQSSNHDVGGGGGGSGAVVLRSHDPNFQIMGLGLASQAHEWNHQSLLRGENNYHPEENSHEDHNWSRQINISRGFSLDQNNPIISHSSSSTMSQLGGLYNINPSNYEVADNHQVLHSSTTNSWSKIPQFFRPSTPSEQPLLPPSPLPLLPPHSQLHFSNNTPFWNASAAAMEVQLPNPTLVEKGKIMGEFRDTNRITSKKTSSTETTNKRPRNETPSPSSTVKVRKEKMGDRITALQQLVSPFGKTDTASVLSEAIEYIKFLHDQIGTLSSPYMKSGASMQQHQQSGNKSKDAEEERNKDIRGRGLCLVPISSTFSVTHETTVDFWTPTFGSTFR